MTDELFPHNIPAHVKSSNFIDIVIRSKYKDCIVKISPYECSFGFRRSQFLRDMLDSTKQSRPSVRKQMSKTVSFERAIVIEDSNTHDIRAALEYIHKGTEGINFQKVSALTYAKTAQYLMMEALHDYLVILSFNTITGRQAEHLGQLYRQPHEELEVFPPVPPPCSCQPPVLLNNSSSSRTQITSWEAYFVLRQLGYTTAPDARIRIQLDKWVSVNPRLLTDPTLYDIGPAYLSGLDIARLVSKHVVNKL